ncbi:MAG: HIT family protein, partial [Anaerolineae bacterium]|nr:HIT family protein [Anaerolineae bacterium]
PHIVYEDEQVIAFLNQFPTQEGYTIVCPKRHVERFETELTEAEWVYLQTVVQKVAQAVSETTHAIRMYIASLGSPERNAHLHIHICPCPPGTPFKEQQFAAMEMKDGRYLQITEGRMRELAHAIRDRINDNVHVRK